MIILILAVGVVAAVFAMCIAPNLGRRSRPAEDRTGAIAAASERIVSLHRQLGIDPIYDPVPGAREPTPVHPLLVRTCPFDCDWMMGGSDLITLTAFVNHISAKHEVAPSVLASLRRAVSEAQRRAAQNVPANGAPSDYDG